MKTTHALLTIICALLINFSSLAQGSEEISPTLQKEMIEELSRLIKKEYVLEDIGFKMATKLDVLKNESMEAIASDEFIKTINQELWSIYMDKHLAVVNPDKFKQFQEMFGLDEGSHQNKKERTHDKREESDSNNQHENSHDAHKVQGKSEASALTGSRVINRDGRTNIGLIKLNRFNGSEKGLENMHQLLTSFIGVDVVIIDLRNCKGGDADMVKALSGYFFNKATYLVSTIGRKDEKGNREERERWSIRNELSEEFSNTPIYIMTSSRTFSAAESFSFGLQVTDRATIVGENTGGGGHMNTFFALPGGYGASISVGRTFDNKTGKGFQGTGVEADIQVEADHAFAKTLELIQETRTVELAYDESKEKVHQTLQQLSEAWYKGDIQKAESLIYHKSKTYLKTDNANVVKELNLLKLIETGTGSKTPREVRNREISIYEVRDDKTAIARLMFRDQIHYLHLINDNGSWKIISDLITKKRMHC
ncbi:MAG: S41 family peptidase [Allomuricauda sp.]|jgi:retinol-binding protein 3